MFDSLLESRSRPERRTGGGAVSVATHAAAIGIAVVLTAPPPVALSAPAPEILQVSFDPPPPAPPPRAQPRLAAAVAPTGAPVAIVIPDLRSLVIPDVSLDVPAVDFAIDPATVATQPSARSGADRVGSSGGGGWGDGPPGASLCGEDRSIRFAAKPTPPVYPEMLRRSGIEGRVVLRFDVDAAGRVDQRSVVVVESTHDLFTAAARATLPALRFLPATTCERAIRVGVILPFAFTQHR